MLKKGKLTPVGKKIKAVRTKKKITFEQLANDTGISIGCIKDIEAGKTIPPIGTLLQIARTLEIESCYFLKEQEPASEDRAKAYARRTENYAYETLTPGAENKHMKAFRVSIDPCQEHKGVGYQHEGEEFIYVLAGNIEVFVGEHLNTLKKDDSLHFNSGIRHKIRNISEETAVLLVVIYGS